MKKQVALYARVSTDDGRQDVSQQLIPLRQYCQQRGWEVYREYVDQMSGARDDRPEYTAMMDAVRKRKVSAVLVFRFDRFSRSTRTLIEALEEFKGLGVDFISYNENVDSSSPVGKVLFTIISAFSEMERSVLRERVCNSLRICRENGQILGRPRKGMDIGKALQLRQEGLGVRRIAKQIGVSHATVFRYLKSVSNTPSLKTA